MWTAETAAASVLIKTRLDVLEITGSTISLCTDVFQKEIW